MNRVYHGWIFNPTGKKTEEGKEVFRAERRDRELIGTREDLEEVIDAIASKELRDDERISATKE